MKGILNLNKNRSISILGRKLQISHEKTRAIKPLVVMTEDMLKVYQAESGKKKHGEILDRWLREYARMKITDRVEYFASEHGYDYNRLSIKDTRSRWGSCSSKRNLNFSWRLILTDEECLDYVVVHELCHLKEMNHSKNYWALVEEIMPDYKVKRKRLRGYERGVLER